METKYCYLNLTLTVEDLDKICNCIRNVINTNTKTIKSLKNSVTQSNNYRTFWLTRDFIRYYEEENKELDKLLSELNIKKKKTGEDNEVK
jgi:ferritin